MRRSLGGLLVAILIAGCATAQPSASPPAPTSSSTQTALSTPEPAPTATAAPVATPEPTTDPLRLMIWQAALDTIDTETVSLSMDLQFNDSIAVADGTRIRGSGSAAFGHPMRVALAANYGALGLGDLKMIVNDTLLYMKGDALKRFNLKAGKWLLVDLTSDDPRSVPFRAITQGQNDVSAPIYYLFGAQRPVATLSDQKIAGVNARHYGMPVDLEAASRVAPVESRESLLDAVAAFRTAGVDRVLQGEVWIDADGLVRRTTYVYTVGQVAGGGTMTVTYDFADFGDPLDLGIPAKKDVVALEDLPS